MSFTHTITYSWNDGAQTISKSLSSTAETQYYLDPIAEATADSTYHSITVSLIAAQIVAMYVVSDQPVRIQFVQSSDNTTVNVDLNTLGANKPYQWISGNGTTCPITQNIGTIKINNALAVLTTNNANVKFRFLINNAS